MSRIIAASVMALTLGAGAIGAAAQSGVVDTAKKTGDVTKQAVTETGKATKKSVTKTKNAVTGEARAKCVDGTRLHAKTQKAANAGCSRHGGVAR
jgi:hypothetical protein